MQSKSDIKSCTEKNDVVDIDKLDTTVNMTEDDDNTFVIESDETNELDHIDEIVEDNQSIHLNDAIVKEDTLHNVNGEEEDEKLFETSEAIEVTIPTDINEDIVVDTNIVTSMEIEIKNLMEQHTHKELKDLCKSKGINANGKKYDLAKRCCSNTIDDDVIIAE